MASCTASVTLHVLKRSMEEHQQKNNVMLHSMQALASIVPDTEARTPTLMTRFK